MRYGRLSESQWEIYAYLRKECGIDHANRFKKKLLALRQFRGAGEETVPKWTSFNICEDGTSWIEKVFIPGRHFTPAQKRELERDLEIRVHSPYDCSGQPFSWAVDIFNVNGGAWVYRHMGLDV